jgi:hypothetical protein
MLHFVASIAIFLYRKCGFVVMACAAGFCRFHFGHGNSLVLRRRQIEFNMAFPAFINACMQLMAEFYIPCILDLENNFLYGMAPHTLIYFKNFFAFMACPTGLSLLHPCHSDRLVPFRFVKFGMAAATWIYRRVLPVAEYDRPRFFYSKDHIRNFMTLITPADIKGFLTVVTKAAGSPLFHISHSMSRLFSDIEDSIVAAFAIIANAFVVVMRIVIEFHFAVAAAAENDIFDIHGIAEGKNKSNEQ